MRELNEVNKNKKNSFLFFSEIYIPTDGFLVDNDDLDRL